MLKLYKLNPSVPPLPSFRATIFSRSDRVPESTQVLPILGGTFDVDDVGGKLGTDLEMAHGHCILRLN